MVPFHILACYQNMLCQSNFDFIIVFYATKYTNPTPKIYEKNNHNKHHIIIYIYLFVVYARNARTHKSGPREAQMFASNFCAHFVLVTISDLKIKLHISYIVLIVGDVFFVVFSSK